MATMKAPFNFVPLSDEVYFPDWAEQISHDIPFEDGESGEIELKITAHSPIFVRNGHTKEDAEDKNETYKSFSKIDNNYFIPATSIKGAIRNVLEIMSFGKMSQINNHRYGLRDLQLKEDYLIFFQQSKVHCGWMTKNENEIIIADHGIPRRIAHTELDTLWNMEFSKEFKDDQLLKIEKNRTALYKIEKTENKPKLLSYKELKMNPGNTVDTRIMVCPDKNSNLQGVIVLTGQPSARKDRIMSGDKKTVIKKASGKGFEFVFPIEKVKEYHLNGEEDNGIYQDFCFIYKDSTDWQYWRKKLEKGERIPVFFSVDDNNDICHFGLSYLYKLPYRHRVKDCLPEQHKKSDYDLSECIFGSVGHENNKLKGRVQFSHAFMQSDTNKILQEEKKPYMASPKSSYYPIYLQQKGSNGYMDGSFATMMSDTAKLKGWKRYPIRKELSNFPIPEEGQEKNTSPFYPIDKGAEFCCKVRFHNLKKIEIGALLNAILFNGKNEKGYHSIGFAKAYGYGQVKIEGIQIKIEGTSVIDCLDSINSYISAFTECMKKWMPDYLKSKELKEVMLMSVPHETIIPLKYMELKEFVDCKRQKRNQRTKKLEQAGEYLEYYSNLIKTSPPTVSPQELEAEITFVGKGLFQARLIENKDNRTYELCKESNQRVNLKVGDKIEVKIIKKGGNIEKLKFIKKLS
ncbi:hypothetical protein EZS27_017424 [termite gut metagenome]|uniref:CRISPR type III-associated protein domain-containing protein n=1 Tax=termite gut metagenome TaxID=433724 RepID=A0A5J4RKS9_9ZZZZ